MSEAETASNDRRADLGLDSFRQPPQTEGLSLDKLNRAFASMLDAGDDPYAAPPEADDDPIRQALAADEREKIAVGGRSPADAACEINPRSILEAMLFVGT